jgi:CRP-like cAMP-binding protein
MPAQKVLRRLIASRYRPSQIRQEILLKELQQRNQVIRQKRNRNSSKYWTGVHNGVFYRIPKVTIADKLSSQPPRSLPPIPKLYTPTSPPAQLPPIVGGASCKIPTTAEACSEGAKQSRKEFWERLRQWLRENYSTLILNFGSICTLFGFTRSDVLELRCLSVTGSLCAIVYHVATPPLRIPPLVWSGTFAAVNGYKIYEIMQEREGSVQLTTDQEQMYSHFFMPHGVTPKQFEMIYANAEIVHVKKGTFLVRQNETFHYVYLVVSGTTRASALGRFLTAASTTPTAHEERAGGDSGAWIGEMCLLERVWVKEQKSMSIPVASPSAPQKYTTKHQLDGVDRTKHTAAGYTDAGLLEANKGPQAESDNTGDTKPSAGSKPIDRGSSELPPVVDQPPPPPQHKLVACRSMHTIVAQEDCVVLRWKHADMERLMEKSTDMRAALTRAMTAAIVGKVINFTVSRSKAAQTWGTWLSDWKYNAGAEVYIGEDGKPPTEESSQENLPNYPIKKFR